MKKVLNKIPITFWTIVVILFTVYIVFYEGISLNSAKLEMVSKILTILGIYYLAIQVKKQTKTEQVSNEYLNQSNFSFNGFCVEEIENAKPCLCAEPGSLSYNQCSDIHWFNFKQIGKLPAKELKISLIHHNEQNDIGSLLSKRTQKEAMVYMNDEHQFKLTPHIVPFTLFDNSHVDKFIILLEYQSVYTKVRYKRIYHLNYSPVNSHGEELSTWLNSIKYYGLCLVNIVDSESVTWSQVLKNYWLKVLRVLCIKDSISVKEWLYEI